MTRNIGIIGAGIVGENLGKALLKVGYKIMFSSRDPGSGHAQHVHLETGAPVGLISAVIAFADVIVLAMPPDAALQVAQEHQGQWGSKVLIDLNNRFTAIGAGNSFAHELAALTGGNVVKAFNTIGAEHYLAPEFNGQAATMFIAGNNPDAKALTQQMAMALGFEVVDAGNLDAAIHLENLARFWVHLVRQGMGRDIAFKLLKR